MKASDNELECSEIKIIKDGDEYKASFYSWFKSNPYFKVEINLMAKDESELHIKISNFFST